MSGNVTVLSISMTHLQSVLVRNAVADSIARNERDLKRFPSGSDEHSDCLRFQVELRDLYRPFIQLELGDCTHTLASLSVLDDAPADSHLADVHLKEFDHA